MHILYRPMCDAGKEDDLLKLVDLLILSSMRWKNGSFKENLYQDFVQSPIKKMNKLRVIFSSHFSYCDDKTYN